MLKYHLQHFHHPFRRSLFSLCVLLIFSMNANAQDIFQTNEPAYGCAVTPEILEAQLAQIALSSLNKSGEQSCLGYSADQEIHRNT